VCVQHALTMHSWITLIWVIANAMMGTMKTPWWGLVQVLVKYVMNIVLFVMVHLTPTVMSVCQTGLIGDTKLALSPVSSLETSMSMTPLPTPVFSAMMIITL
jgi:hypothetical protein